MAQAKPGDFFKRNWHGIIIYGYAMTDEEVIRQEVALGASAEEALFTTDMLRNLYEKNQILYGRCASAEYPQGEWGSTPASDTVRITQEEYEAAELRDWNTEWKNPTSFS